MVYNADPTVLCNWAPVVFVVLLLSNQVAASFRSPHEIEGYSYSLIAFQAINHACVGFSPHEAHAHQAFFGWILPTIRTSEFTVLQIVGLDAAVVRLSNVVLLQAYNVCLMLTSSC